MNSQAQKYIGYAVLMTSPIIYYIFKDDIYGYLYPTRSQYSSKVKKEQENAQSERNTRKDY